MSGNQIARTGSWRGLRLALVIGLVGLVDLLAACASTTTITTSEAAPPSRTAPDAADAARGARDRLELAGLYLGRGQTDVALSEVKRALAAQPDLPQAYGLQGLIYSAMGNSPAAEQSFRRALQLAPADSDILHNHGWFLCQQRRWDEADTQFEAALAPPQYRERSRTLFVQGVCRARAGRWLEAETALSRSYELDPANPATAYNLADVLLHRGELERARFYVGRINAQPELISAQSLWLAARIERRSGDIQALQDFGRKLRERFPESAETLLYERGRFDE